MAGEIRLKILRRIIFLNSFTVAGIAVLLIAIFSIFSSMAGLANAINLSGSERMRTILTGYLGSSYLEETKRGQPATALAEKLQNEIAVYNNILDGLIQGSDELNLVPTEDEEILNLIDDWTDQWIPFEDALHTILDDTAEPMRKEMARGQIAVAQAVNLKNSANLVVLAYTDRSNGLLQRVQILLFILVGFVLIMGIIIILFVKNQLQPIGALISTMDIMKEKDLSVRSGINKSNEIGRISQVLDQMTASYDHLIQEIQQTSRTVEHANEDLSATQDQSSRSVRAMVNSVDTVHQSISGQIELVKNNLEAVEREKVEIDKISQLIQDQSGAVEQSSANIEEMVASINAVNNNTTSARELGQGLSGMAKEGWTKIESTMKAMEDIRSAAEEVNESVQGITEIADTTNLLSMNAAIEAAHAGDSGRGFAVVADEINKLAANSGEEAKKISAIMGRTMELIQRGSALSADAGDAFQKILTDIQSTVEIILNIAAAMDEQSYGANDILSSIGTLVELTGQIREIALNEEKNSDELQSSMMDLTNLSEKIFAASEHQKVQGDELLKAIDVLQDVSDRNKMSVESLNDKIEQFKVSGDGEEEASAQP